MKKMKINLKHGSNSSYSINSIVKPIAHIVYKPKESMAQTQEDFNPESKTQTYIILFYYLVNKQQEAM